MKDNISANQFTIFYTVHTYIHLLQMDPSQGRVTSYSGANPLFFRHLKKKKKLS